MNFQCLWSSSLGMLFINKNKHVMIDLTSLILLFTVKIWSFFKHLDDIIKLHLCVGVFMVNYYCCSCCFRFDCCFKFVLCLPMSMTFFLIYFLGKRTIHWLVCLETYQKDILSIFSTYEEEFIWDPTVPGAICTNVLIYIYSTFYFRFACTLHYKIFLT